MRRATLHLADAYILRGTESSVLLEDFGRRLRDTCGQVSCATAEDEFLHSFQVGRLDVFLSHSWSAWWLLKYISLLLYLNGPATIVTTLCTGLGVAPCFKAFVRSSSFFENTTFKTWIVNAKEGLHRYPFEVQYVSLFAGLIVFWITLLSWHRVRKWMVTSYRQTIFLDKVCIHQTNPELKALGIQSIGAILDNSTTMVIAWDATYFERLWCTFELAAFKFRRDQGHVVFLPIMLGLLVGVFACVTQLVEIVRIVVAKMMGPAITEDIMDDYLYDWPLTIFNVFLSHAARAYAREVASLTERVENFSVRDAHCFCCSNDHINPTSGATMPCDRELVYASIAHWHGSDDVEKGLEHFDRLIRDELGKEIHDMLPGWAHVPFDWVVLASIPCCLVYADIYDYDVRIVAYRIVRDFLLLAPAQFGMILAISMQFPARAPLEPSQASLIFRVIDYARDKLITLCTAAVAPLLLFEILHRIPRGYATSALKGCSVRGVGFILFLSTLNIHLYTNWSIFKFVKSHQADDSRAINRQPPIESTSNRPSIQSASSRPAAPDPQPSEPSRRPSTQSTSSRRRSR